MKKIVMTDEQYEIVVAMLDYACEAYEGWNEAGEEVAGRLLGFAAKPAEMTEEQIEDVLEKKDAAFGTLWQTTQGAVMRVKWTAQNEDTDSDGFRLEGLAFLTAELFWLSEQGAPHAYAVENAVVEVLDRDEATIEATVSDELGAWLIKEEIAIVDEDDAE